MLAVRVCHKTLKTGIVLIKSRIEDKKLLYNENLFIAALDQSKNGSIYITEGSNSIGFQFTDDFLDWNKDKQIYDEIIDLNEPKPKEVKIKFIKGLNTQELNDSFDQFVRDVYLKKENIIKVHFSDNLREVAIVYIEGGK
ncbi:MAG: hypothetical protein ACRCX2_01820 [Paraclostridium sp.]